MATDVEGLINQALVDIGYPMRIGSIEEGSKASIAALEIYGQTRDELLRAGTWPLARRANIPLILLKGPPPPGGYNPAAPWSAEFPPLGWLYEYAYPADMVELNAIIDPRRPVPDLDPVAATWRIDNDNSLVDSSGNATDQQRVILADIKAAIAVYTGKVIDPRLFEPGFTAVLIKHLADKLARALAPREGLEQTEMTEGAALLGPAEKARG